MEYRSKMYDILGRIPGHRRWSGMAKNLSIFSESNKAQDRKYVLDFYDKFGEAATKKAFQVDRKLIYVWRKRLNNSHGVLVALIPGSTRPHTVRFMETNPLIVSRIKTLREKRPRLGKEKIKPLLDWYCLNEGIPSVSVSTIGKIIKRKNFFFQGQGRIYHHPSEAYLRRMRLKKTRLRVKYAPKPVDFGHIQSDVAEIVEQGVKRYLFNAIDIRMKFAFSHPYNRITSANNCDFYDKFKSVYPGTVTSWQTDNGSENLGLFEEKLGKDSIPHFFTYPRCPKINGVVERFNRTIQEEFVQCCDILPDTLEYRRALGEYLLFYNTERVHKSLGLKSPLDYLLKEGVMSKMSMTRTGS
jgi:transposase InsO family protein